MPLKIAVKNRQRNSDQYPVIAICHVWDFGMLSRFISGWAMGLVLLAGVVMASSCSRLNKRNDGSGQGGSTVDEGGGNTEQVETTNTETGGSVTEKK
jgi:hypothetical protein